MTRRKSGKAAEHALQQLLAGGAADLHEALERGADAVPAGDEMAVLAPAEHPGDGAEIVERLGAEAAGRARAELQPGQLGQRAGGVIVGDQAGMIGEPAIGGLGDAGERLHGFVELGIARLRFVGAAQAVAEHAGRQQFHMGERGAAVGVVGGDHLALLGHAQAAGDRAGGLGLDGAAGGRAAAADRAAAAVEIGDLDIELCGRRAPARSAP